MERWFYGRREFFMGQRYRILQSTEDGEIVVYDEKGNQIKELKPEIYNAIPTTYVSLDLSRFSFVEAIGRKSTVPRTSSTLALRTSAKEA
ncbi:hypothetical protein AMTR_s01433p00000160 [Amborella trichopoda]|uniref:Uncharacterized protein n=1 Tax=Amborella trichopoda TaxID=13333 RepID=U5CVY1_AMBTC|nr:hypothetical protein AMTR_s01433p00000160 [Amborella trichopoda]